MPIKQILTVPDPILLKTCEKVKPGDPELKQLVQDLIETLNNAKDPEGAGLAAPQIGVLKRVLVARNFLDDPYIVKDPRFENVILINPKLITHSKETNVDWEACLSIPDTYGKVQRYNTIKVRTSSVDGEEFVIKATGYLARVIQHEMDHLEGILFTSKTTGTTMTEKELDQLLVNEAKKK